MQVSLSSGKETERLQLISHKKPSRMTNLNGFGKSKEKKINKGELVLSVKSAVVVLTVHMNTCSDISPWLVNTRSVNSKMLVW